MSRKEQKSPQANTPAPDSPRICPDSTGKQNKKKKSKQIQSVDNGESKASDLEKFIPALAVRHDVVSALAEPTTPTATPSVLTVPAESRHDAPEQSVTVPVVDAFAADGYVAVATPDQQGSGVERPIVLAKDAPDAAVANTEDPVAALETIASVSTGVRTSECCALCATMRV